MVAVAVAVAVAFAVVEIAVVVVGCIVVLVAPYKVRVVNPTSVADRVPSGAGSTGRVLSYVKN